MANARCSFHHRMMATEPQRHITVGSPLSNESTPTRLGLPYASDRSVQKRKLACRILYIYYIYYMGRTNTNWPTDHRSQCNLKLNSCQCTANYRPILSSERAPYMRNKESNCHSNKCNIWSLVPKGARHQDELADWPSVVMWLRLRNIYKIYVSAFSNLILRITTYANFYIKGRGTKRISRSMTYLNHKKYIWEMCLGYYGGQATTRNFG
jgi:hypothetical protein